MNLSLPGKRFGVHIDVLSLSGDRIAEEVFVDRRHITVGRSRANGVVLPDEEAPRSMPLFHRSDNGYKLHYTDATSGDVTRSPGAACLELSEMHAMSSAHHGGYDLQLPEGARGRVEVGEATLVFEVFATPGALVAARSRPRWMFFAAAGAVLLLASPVWFPWLRGVVRPASATREIDDYIWVGPPDPSRDLNRDPTRTAQMPPAQAVRHLAGLQASVNPIYRRELRRRPALRGDLVARVALDTTGHVTDVTMIRDDLGSPEVRSRLIEALRRWHAPLPFARAAQFEIPYHFPQSP